eukprot:1045977_1
MGDSKPTPTEWISEEQLISEKDKDETKRKRRKMIELYVEYATTAVKDHGLGKSEAWAAHYGKDQENVLSILAKADFNDMDFSRWLLWIYNVYTQKGKGAKATLRHAHSWGSYMCLQHEISPNLAAATTFGATNRLWGSLWKKVKKVRSDYAPGTTEEDERILRNWKITIPGTNIVRNIDDLKRKHLWTMRQATANRKTRMHTMLKGDIEIDVQFTPDPTRPQMMFTTQGTKHVDEEGSDLGPCNCPPGPHIKFNDMCRVGLKELYDREVETSDEFIKKSRCTAKDNGWYWRKTNYKPREKKKKIHDDDKARYFSYVRWGKDGKYGMGLNLSYLDDKFHLSIKKGINPDVRRNKKMKRFTKAQMEWYPGDSQPRHYGDDSQLVDLHGGTILSRVMNSEMFDYDGGQYHGLYRKSKYDDSIAKGKDVWEMYMKPVQDDKSAPKRWVNQ